MDKACESIPGTRRGNPHGGKLNRALQQRIPEAKSSARVSRRRRSAPARCCDACASAGINQLIQQEAIMFSEQRSISFILAATNHGTLIVNRNDGANVGGRQPHYGVGPSLLETASFDGPKVEFLLALLRVQRQRLGDGVVFLDCGANVGVFSIEAGRMMTQWGAVHAFEQQNFVFYALAGNVAINNLFNVQVHNVALGAANEIISIPQVDYRKPVSYGSQDIKESASPSQLVAQSPDHAPENECLVRQIALDELGLRRLDLVKIDLESKKLDVLRGARSVIGVCRPLIWMEIFETDVPAVKDLLTRWDYRLFETGQNMLAVPGNDSELLKRFWFDEHNVLFVNV
jgi:FkbM family methyltransferase